MPLTVVQIDGNGLRAIRIVRGLSQRRLAELAGLASWRVWKIENDIVRPTSEEIAKLLGALTAEEVKQGTI
jgi:transcriptional regulator with XRE-family HTH domain